MTPAQAVLHEGMPMMMGEQSFEQLLAKLPAAWGALYDVASFHGSKDQDLTASVIELQARFATRIKEREQGREQEIARRRDAAAEELAEVQNRLDVFLADVGPIDQRVFEIGNRLMEAEAAVQSVRQREPDKRYRTQAQFQSWVHELGAAQQKHDEIKASHAAELKAKAAFETNKAKLDEKIARLKDELDSLAAGKLVTPPPAPGEVIRVIAQRSFVFHLPAHDDVKEKLSYLPAVDRIQFAPAWIRETPTWADAVAAGAIREIA